MNHAASEDCPYCKTSIPSGAVVCVGCGAEKQIGSTQHDLAIGGLIAFVICIVLGAIGISALKDVNTWGVGAFIGVVVTWLRNRGKIRWFRKSIKK